MTAFSYQYPPFPERMDPDDLAMYPVFTYKGRIEIVATETDARKAVKRLLKESVLGLDTEKKPSFRPGEEYPLSLLQLAGETCVYLFYLSMPGVSRALIPIWKSARVIKAGIAIHDDLKEIQCLATSFQPNAFVDVAQKTRPLGIIHTGLRNLAAILLKVRISKTAQRSDWSRCPLSKSQIRYAATDAWVTRALYVHATHLLDTVD